MTATDQSKRGKGRKKIEIKRIASAESRQVCFSKRRQGLFNKANELCILCGAEAAMVVFSPAGKPFSYGHPTVDAVLSRFHAGGCQAGPSPATEELCESIKCNLEYRGNVLVEEKRRHEQLEAALKGPWPTVEPFWWSADVQLMGMAELMDCENNLLQFQLSVSQAIDECWTPEPTAEGGDALAVAIPYGAGEAPGPEPLCWGADGQPMRMEELLEYESIMPQHQFAVAQDEQQNCIPEPAAVSEETLVVSIHGDVFEASEPHQPFWLDADEQWMGIAEQLEYENNMLQHPFTFAQAEQPFCIQDPPPTGGNALAVSVPGGVIETPRLEPFWCDADEQWMEIAELMEYESILPQHEFAVAQDGES